MGAASPEAYDKTDLTLNVTGFHKAPYMLVHGTGDDNVHFQNTGKTDGENLSKHLLYNLAEFAKALTDDNVQFDMMIYTDDSHNLGSGRWHLYNM